MIILYIFATLAVGVLCHWGVMVLWGTVLMLPFVAFVEKSFAPSSGDEGIHHLTPDEQGRLVVLGLLTATLSTKVGGNHNVMARTMDFEFLRSVFTEFLFH